MEEQNAYSALRLSTNNLHLLKIVGFGQAKAFMRKIFIEGVLFNIEPGFGCDSGSITTSSFNMEEKQVFIW